MPLRTHGARHELSAGASIQSPLRPMTITIANRAGASPKSITATTASTFSLPQLFRPTLTHLRSSKANTVSREHCTSSMQRRDACSGLSLPCRDVVVVVRRGMDPAGCLGCMDAATVSTGAECVPGVTLGRRRQRLSRVVSMGGAAEPLTPEAGARCSPMLSSPVPAYHLVDVHRQRD